MTTKITVHLDNDTVLSVGLLDKSGAVSLGIGGPTYLAPVSILTSDPNALRALAVQASAAADLLEQAAQAA